MDPITIATRRFLEELDHFWKRHPTRIARLIASTNDRPHILKALRLQEYDPANRRPLFIHEAPFDAAAPYFASLCEKVTTDYEEVRKGAAEEGVTFEPLTLPLKSTALPPETHAAIVLTQIAERLAKHLDGALVTLLPKVISNAEDWRTSIEHLTNAKLPSSLRIAILDPEDGPLSGLLGAGHDGAASRPKPAAGQASPDGARFSFSMDDLFDFAEQQTQRKSSGPDLPPPPALPEAQRTTLEQAGQKTPTPETAAALQALFLKGARAAAKNDFKSAVGDYRRARDLCHNEGLQVEEAAATFALAGATLAAGSRPTAQATYGQAALLAAEQKLWSIASQAKLGEAGVGWMEKDFARAARAYAEAASLAERGNLPPLHIEALRMEGLCHQHRGAETEALAAWRRAIAVGTELEEPTRAATNFRDVVTALADLLEKRGLHPQAAHIRGLLEHAAKESPWA